MIPRRFDPARSLTAPKSLLALIGPNPRAIADDIWAMLVWAGLNLTADDLPRMGRGSLGAGLHTHTPSRCVERSI